MPVFPPAYTWVSFLACTVFQAAVSFMCFHKHGPELARRGPTILGKWLKRTEEANGGKATVIQPPSSFAQGWRLGALHERFFNGARAGSASNLQEAGEVLGVGRPLTEVEYCRR